MAQRTDRLGPQADGSPWDLGISPTSPPCRHGRPGSRGPWFPVGLGPSLLIHPGGRAPRYLDRISAIDTEGPRCRWDPDRRVATSPPDELVISDDGPGSAIRQESDLTWHLGSRAHWVVRLSTHHDPGLPIIPWQLGSLVNRPPGPRKPTRPIRWPSDRPDQSTSRAGGRRSGPRPGDAAASRSRRPGGMGNPKKFQSTPLT
jgi:hypothetical protein